MRKSDANAAPFPVTFTNLRRRSIFHRDIVVILVRTCPPCRRLSRARRVRVCAYGSPKTNASKINCQCHSVSRTETRLLPGFEMAFGRCPVPVASKGSRQPKNHARVGTVVDSAGRNDVVFQFGFAVCSTRSARIASPASTAPRIIHLPRCVRAPPWTAGRLERFTSANFVIAHTFSDSNRVAAKTKLIPYT